MQSVFVWMESSGGAVSLDREAHEAHEAYSGDHQITRGQFPQDEAEGKGPADEEEGDTTDDELACRSPGASSNVKVPKTPPINLKGCPWSPISIYLSGASKRELKVEEDEDEKEEKEEDGEEGEEEEGEDDEEKGE